MIDVLRENKYFNEVAIFLKRKNLYENSYIVGGTIRDLLLRRELKDLDFAINADTIQLAKEFAQQTNGSFVLLDDFFSIGRVVKNDITIDFGKLRRGSIEADLSERDFTINALATPLSLNKVIDPFGGVKDIENKLIKIVQEENLKADPLRVLRAYRFHATLKFEIEETTRETLKRNAHLMKVCAKERIKDELWKILSVEDSFKTIQLMALDNIFNALFKVESFISVKLNLKALMVVEEILKEPEKIFSITISKIAQKKYMLPSLKFTALFNFQTSELIKQIKPSKKEEKFIENLVTAADRIKKIETLLDKVRFVRDFEHILYFALIYGLAIDPINKARAWFYREIENFYRKNYLKNKKKIPLIKGEDILQLGIKPSPIVGEILERIETLVLAGKISKKEEAIEEIKKRY